MNAEPENQICNVFLSPAHKYIFGQIVLQLSEADGAYRLISCPLETIHQLPPLPGRRPEKKNLMFHVVGFSFFLPIFLPVQTCLFAKLGRTYKVKTGPFDNQY